jgi:hypothetical protein
VAAVIISLVDPSPTRYVATEQQTADIVKPTKKVKIAWACALRCDGNFIYHI